MNINYDEKNFLLGHFRKRPEDHRRWNASPMGNLLGEHSPLFVRAEKINDRTAYMISMSSLLASMIKFTQLRLFDREPPGGFPALNQRIRDGEAVLSDLDEEDTDDEDNDSLNFSAGTSPLGSRIDWINECIDGRQFDLEMPIDDNYGQWKGTGRNDFYPGPLADRPRDHNGFQTDLFGAAYIMAEFNAATPPIRIFIDVCLQGHYGSNGEHTSAQRNKFTAQKATAVKQSTYFIFSQKLRAAQDEYNVAQAVDLTLAFQVSVAMAIATGVLTTWTMGVAAACVLFAQIETAAGAVGAGNAAQGAPPPPAQVIPVRCVATCFNAEPGNSENDHEVQSRIMAWHKFVETNGNLVTSAMKVRFAE
jgi:hypothetical protein